MSNPTAPDETDVQSYVGVDLDALIDAYRIDPALADRHSADVAALERFRTDGPIAWHRPDLREWSNDTNGFFRSITVDRDGFRDALSNARDEVSSEPMTRERLTILGLFRDSLALDSLALLNRSRGDRVRLSMRTR